MAARSLLHVPQVERANLCARLLSEADIADRYTRRLGKSHPLWGRGTLREVSGRRSVAAERACNDPEYCACLIMVLAGISDRP
jgi:hypothetical protein